MLQCSSSPVSTEEQPTRELTSAEKRLVKSDNQFGFEFFKEIIKEEKDKNVFISPLSVSMALGMTYNGANGETEEAMHQTLQFGDLSTQEVNESYKSLIELLTGLDPKVKFQIANSIWHRKNFPAREEFIDLCKEYFQAKVEGLDFNDQSSVDIINRWVDENTSGKIEQIIQPPINPLTMMFLINAIYFKGAWTYEFDKEMTMDAVFHLPDGSQETCKMMEQKGEFQYFGNSDFQAVDLPYGDGDFSMSVFLPRPLVDIDSLIAKFNQENWDNWIKSFTPQSFTLFLPKFKLEYELNLNDVLTAMGMGIAFQPYQADFTKIYQGIENLYISKVKHKTFVEVNEEGTEAAAVTSVEMGLTSVGLLMRVDRPFIFVIRENQSQTILFMGKITEPDYE
ncbi:MAG: hypothetical protein AMJ90_02595 [candidate division Zixibacteria bacterium SM23_73_2]|nr:MAG: hypothetical protein AMJ90_02595 [candidate division Zixibacteria bacterium SM23_73_2]